MNHFDTTIIAWINQFSQHSWMLDQLAHFLNNNKVVKGGALATLIWWTWFRQDARSGEHRARIVATLLGCVAAMAVARTIAIYAPFRVRPLHEQALNFRVPIGLSSAKLEGWSSFPSDHATLFFALATGLLFVSRRTGVLALVYTTVVIALPRVYLGLHYPTDILAGAAIGAASAWLSVVWLPPTRLMKWIMATATNRPQLFYPTFFLFTYQIADLFDSSREFFGSAFVAIQHIAGHG